MTCYVSSGTLNPTHSLTHSVWLIYFRSWRLINVCTFIDCGLFVVSRQRTVRVVIWQDAKLLLSAVHEVVGRSFTNWQTLNVEDVELAVTLLYQLAEALPVSIALLESSRSAVHAALASPRRACHDINNGIIVETNITQCSLWLPASWKFDLFLHRKLWTGLRHCKSNTWCLFVNLVQRIFHHNTVLHPQKCNGIGER